MLRKEKGNREEGKNMSMLETDVQPRVGMVEESWSKEIYGNHKRNSGRKRKEQRRVRLGYTTKKKTFHRFAFIYERKI